MISYYLLTKINYYSLRNQRTLLHYFSPTPVLCNSVSLALCFLAYPPLFLNLLICIVYGFKFFFCHFLKFLSQVVNFVRMKFTCHFAEGFLYFGIRGIGGDFKNFIGSGGVFVKHCLYGFKIITRYSQIICNGVNDFYFQRMHMIISL